MSMLLVAVPLLVAGLLAGWRARGSDRRALASMAGGAAAVLIGWSLIDLGDGSGIDWTVALVGAPALAFLFVARLRPALAPTDRWTTHRTVEPVLAGAEPVGRVPSPAGAVGRALGRVESRELARSPWFGVGLGFCVLLFVLFGIVFVTDTPTWAELFHLAPWLAHPLVGFTVLACHRNVTRDRRDRAEELFESCPTAPLTRTAGFLLAAPVPVAALVLMFAAIGAGAALRAPLIHGAAGLDGVAELASGVVLGVGGVALGVALGRWVRFGLAPMVAVVAVAFATLSLNGVGGNGWHPATPLSTAPTVEDIAPMFQDRPEWWHLLWVSGLIAVVALVALARHRRDRSIALVTAVAVAALVTAGVGATRPMPAASAERIAALIAHPEEHQDCRSTDGPLRVCAFRSESELLDRVTARVAPIAAALPAGLETMTFRQAYDGDLGDLPPEVRRLLGPDDLVRPGREVRLGFGDVLDDVAVDPGFAVALAALGSPPEPDDELLPTVLAGQARGVVAIWLATRGLDAAETARASTSPAPASTDPFERGSLEVSDPCSAPAAVWSAQDLAAARAVLALPAERVHAAVLEGWDRWIDPATGTDELLAVLGLPSPGPYDRVEARPGQGC